MLVFGKVIDNSGNDSANKASDAVDNRLWTRWSSQGYPQWLELDLGSIRTIRSSELDPYLGRAYSYYIETKIGDRDQYLPLVDRRSNTIGGFAISDTFPPVQARYLRLTVTGSYEYTSDEVSILEFKLFGDAIKRVPGGPVALAQNYPNPFNLGTTIEFDLSEASQILLTVVDVAGRVVATLVDERMEAGLHRVTWDGIDDAGLPIASGTYFYQVTSGSFAESRKMVISK